MKFNEILKSFAPIDAVEAQVMRCSCCCGISSFFISNRSAMPRGTMDVGSSSTGDVGSSSTGDVGLSSAIIDVGADHPMPPHVAKLRLNESKLCPSKTNFNIQSFFGETFPMLSLDIVIPLCSFHWFTKDGGWGEDFAARPRGPPRGQAGPRPDVGLGERDGGQAPQGFPSQERE